jgi:ABC-type polysaccharide/polyol phosphate transport system ATPase subunit
MSAIVLDNVYLNFPIYGGSRSFRKALFERAIGGFIQHDALKGGRDRVIINALKGVSLELNDGDRLGLVGHNGAGKSSLLKVLAGVYEPTVGRVLVSGAITPYFDMVPGMDLEDTGYESIITAGLLLNLKRREIEAKIPEIEEFSELGEYLSLPLRTYSSGMIARLGFSLATTLQPDILLIDEGVGAGDARFAERAAQRMKQFIGNCNILVLASHADELVTSFCNKAALMESGTIVDIGPVSSILSLYHEKTQTTHKGLTGSDAGLSTIDIPHG